MAPSRRMTASPEAAAKVRRRAESGGGGIQKASPARRPRRTGPASGATLVLAVVALVGVVVLMPSAAAAVSGALSFGAELFDRRPGLGGGPSASVTSSASPRRLHSPVGLNAPAFGFVCFLVAYVVMAAITAPLHLVYHNRVKAREAEREEAARKLKGDAAANAADAKKVKSEDSTQQGDETTTILGDESASVDKEGRNALEADGRGWGRSPTSSSRAPRWKKEDKEGRTSSKEGEAFANSLKEFDVALEAIKLGVNQEKPQWYVEKKGICDEGNASEKVSETRSLNVTKPVPQANGKGSGASAPPKKATSGSKSGPTPKSTQKGSVSSDASRLKKKPKAKSAKKDDEEGMHSAPAQRMSGGDDASGTKSTKSAAS